MRNGECISEKLCLVFFSFLNGEESKKKKKKENISRDLSPYHGDVFP